MASQSSKLLPRASTRFLPVDSSDFTVDDYELSSQSPEEFAKAVTPTDGKRRWYRGFLGLLVTTICSTLLLVADRQHVAYSGAFYTRVDQKRASVQIAVQIVAGALGVVQTSAIRRLFNYTTRIRLARQTVPLELLPFWSSVSSASIRWSLALHHLIPLLLFIFACVIPGALWAGAISPVGTSVTSSAILNLPQYNILKDVREWPSEIDRSGPSLRDEKGYFTYSPGVLYQGLLTQALSTATTIDGSERHHAKYDNSNFLYVGRSFGTGASVGLVDDHILSNPLATSYTYQEIGYESKITCIYNSSAEFYLEEDGNMLYAAQGYLPDSIVPEFSVYVGHGPDAITAIGVAAQKPGSGNVPRYLGITAGSSYGNLDTTQCVTQFEPALFDVAVDILNKNISATRTNTTARDMEPLGNLTHVLERQFELYSNDLTNIYQSVLGNSINFSIADYRTYLSSPTYQGPQNTDEEINLTGLTNSVTAMTDDLLVAYASAQLMIAKDTTQTPAKIIAHAIRFGQPIYVVATFIINCLILLIVAEEAIRTKKWKSLGDFDFDDLESLAVASSRGGQRLAEMAQHRERVSVTLKQSSAGDVLVAV